MKSIALKRSLLLFLLLSVFQLQASPWTSPPDTLTGAGVSSTTVSTNATGASIAAYVDGDGRISAELRPAGKNSSWAAAVQLSTALETVTNPVVAINDNGDAIAIWTNTTNTTIEAVFRPAATSTWSASSVISTAAGSAVDSQQVAMNNTIAVGVWRHDAGTTERIETNTYSIGEGTWRTAEFLSLDNASAPQVAVNAASTTVVAWTIQKTKTEIEANTRISGTSWNSASIEQLSATAQNGANPAVGIDASSNPVAAWSYQYDGTNYKIQASTWNGTQWTTTANLSGILTAVGEVRLAVDGNGDAAAVWSGTASGGTLQLIYAAFLKTLSTNSWTAETAVSRSTIATEVPRVGIDALGNATIIWNELVTVGTNEIIQSRFYLHTGSTWPASEIVAISASAQKAGEPALSVGSGGSAISVWTVGTGGTLFEEAAYFTVSYPALNVTARRKRDRFMGQKDLLNQLRGNNHPNITPVSYKVFKSDGTTLIQTVPTSTMLKFEQHNRQRNIFETYQVVTNNSNGGESFPFSYTVTK